MIKDNPKQPCSWCRSKRTFKKGKRKTRQGTKQIYYCMDCRSKFTEGRVIFPEEFEYKPQDRQTYPQNWSAYTKAQCEEKLMFLQILSELASKVRLPRNGMGRPRSELSDILFACFLKVYTGFSGRRLKSDLEISRQQGYISEVPHFTTVMKAFNSKELKPAFQEIIKASSYPLKEVEQDFAADSTGFSTSQFSRWFDTKWGKDKTERIWVKAHAMSGVKTNIITSIEISEGNVGDSPYFIPLLDGTRELFKIREVSADKAYSSKANLEAVVGSGALPYIPFRSNIIGKAGGSKVWSTMYNYFMNNRQEFLERYHKRSNVETTFSMIKRKFGNNLRTKSLIGNINEILCKAICHNIGF